MLFPRCSPIVVLMVGTLAFAAEAPDRASDAPPLPGTRPLRMTGDIASQLVEGVDRFLLKEIDKSVERRSRHWQRDTSSPENYQASIEPHRRARWWPSPTPTRRPR